LFRLEHWEEDSSLQLASKKQVLHEEKPLGACCSHSKLKLEEVLQAASQKLHQAAPKQLAK